MVVGQVAQPFEPSKRKHKKSDKWKEQMKTVVALRGDGLTYKAIGTEMGISVGMVRHYLEEAALNPLSADITAA